MYRADLPPDARTASWPIDVDGNREERGGDRQ